MYSINGANFVFLDAQAAQLRDARVDHCAALWRNARHVWARGRARGRLGQLWRLLIGRPRRLSNLGDLGYATGRQHYLGLRSVPLARLVGTEGRGHDFDRSFNPLREHTRERWQGIYVAMLQGTSLPPVTLIEAGGRYYVRDGHHRVSVARALGRLEIEAEVTVWDVAGPLPGEARAPVGRAPIPAATAV